VVLTMRRLYAAIVGSTTSRRCAFSASRVPTSSAPLGGCDIPTQATAASYFGNVSKERIIEAVREGASDSEARRFAGVKKRAMAKAAETLLRDKGWLPSILRRESEQLSGRVYALRNVSFAVRQGIVAGSSAKMAPASRP
jgi:hypothetical protein